MSDSLFYADTRRLREHSARILEERRAAYLLYEQIRRAYDVADPANAALLGQMMQEANRLVDYFGAMADVIEDASDQLERLSVEIGLLLEDARRW